MSIQLAQVYTDFQGLDALRSQARADKEAALDEVSRQFEALFTQMMLKSMRQASFGGGLFDSKQSEFYRDMYDQQLGVEMSKQHGLGLADMLKRQLGGESLADRTGMQVEDYFGHPVFSIRPQQAAGDTASADKAGLEKAPEQSLGNTPEEFIQALWPAASEAAAKINLQPEALIAQAALETGWGKHVMQRGDNSSHNLFGIKADQRWDGEKVKVSTLEYKDGVALKTRAAFRAYDSFADSFQDYVSFVTENPRYADALSATGDAKAYFRELQQAGYATDPAYANKIARILDSEPMRTALSQVKGGVTSG